ncbi:MAG TPA: carboxylating nicotinate-nucleotide diphosphorylase [Bacteroidales bacterium]|nr:carboxylating nicotinate-nucleotide diphosphorylase [Bacteroidales bacterium]HNR41097.1 carboxylating nicotinate-nucleotide diphosphorylase [Bacteroidales bacterium]HPM17667.1 carboxylating nicotinate-nucleotide diphosphorylase [Bacteroidales bacterium]
MVNDNLRKIILRSLEEDIGDGDHSSRACIPSRAKGKARLLIKEKGILAGCRVALEIFSIVDGDLSAEVLIKDGSPMAPGDIVFYIEGRKRSILKSERLVLNIMQRMSGIATRTREYADRLSGLKTKVLDTRKTTPGLRFLEKEAVRIGGGLNHRMGLYDMILLKDNHIDYAGGIEKAISRTIDYLNSTGKKLKIEIEARNLEDVRRIIKAGGVDRIMLDNFSLGETKAAVELIGGKFETESSGGITLENLRDYAECGVDFISVGALTHQVRSLDMSLKAV